MTVRINETADSRLAIEAVDDPSELDAPAVVEALLAFTVVSRAPGSLVIDPGPNVLEAVDFLVAQSSTGGVHVEPSANLTRLLGQYHEERRRISRAREKGIPQVELTLPAGVFVDSFELLPHQAQGVRHALGLGNLAEFSVQGAGKTAEVLALFAIWRASGVVDRLLVIGPTSSHAPWEDEAARWFREPLATLRWSGSVAQRTRLVPSFGTSDLILCSYETAIRDVEMLGGLLRSYRCLLVLDESHYIKNFLGGARSVAASRLAPYATRRMILTGTPAPHSLLDLWTQFAFLWPGGIGDLAGDRRQFRETVENSENAVSVLRERLQPFFHRTTQNELGLPEPDREFEQIPMDTIPPEQAEIINLLGMRVLREASQLVTEGVDQDILRQWQRARMTRLLQAVSNPGLLSMPLDASNNAVGDVDLSGLLEDVARFRADELTSAKISWAVEKATQLIREGKKVIIWTWWVANIELLLRLLSDYSPLALYGGVKPHQEDWDDPEEESRERNIHEFKTRDDRPLLIANPAACAESISLHQHCHDAIYVDRTFNCGQFLQSLNRIHRVGLPEGAQTTYWIPFIDCAIERVVDARLTARQTTMYGFLDDDAAIVGIGDEEESDVADDAEEVGRAFDAFRAEVEKPSAAGRP